MGQPNEVAPTFAMNPPMICTDVIFGSLQHVSPEFRRIIAATQPPLDIVRHGSGTMTDFMALTRLWPQHLSRVFLPPLSFATLPPREPLFSSASAWMQGLTLAAGREVGEMASQIATAIGGGIAPHPSTTRGRSSNEEPDSRGGDAETEAETAGVGGAPERRGAEWRHPSGGAVGSDNLSVSRWKNIVPVLCFVVVFLALVRRSRVVQWVTRKVTHALILRYFLQCINVDPTTLVMWIRSRIDTGRSMINSLAIPAKL